MVLHIEIKDPRYFASLETTNSYFYMTFSCTLFLLFAKGIGNITGFAHKNKRNNIAY